MYILYTAESKRERERELWNMTFNTELKMTCNRKMEQNLDVTRRNIKNSH
jgi:hypothetical protein